MRDATVDRLSKIIAPRPDDNPDKGKGLQSFRPHIHLHLSLAEGWFSLFLLALVVYSTIWSVQSAAWVDNLSVLSLTTALGLLCGLIASKQHRVPRLFIHLIAVTLAILLAFWQTAGADYAGNTDALLRNMGSWMHLALIGGTSSDDTIFLFFITALGFLLAYTSAWLVYRTRSPWLMILANAVVLLINLSNIDAGFIIFLVIFLVASLLLLLRFNLYESSVRWRRLGLRCSDDLGWEFMQAGALVSIAILILSWLLPWGYTNDQVAQIWTLNQNPWVVIQNTWNRLIAVTGGENPANHGNFTGTLTLGGNPNLVNTVVFRVKTTDTTQYLQSLSYDYYSGRSWSNSPQTTLNEPSNQVWFDSSTGNVRQVTQRISVVNPPGEDQPYLWGAPQIVSTDQGAQVSLNKNDETTVAWLRNNGRLVEGSQYTVVSYVSDADLSTLRSVPLPAKAPVIPPNFDGPPPMTAYNPDVVKTYTQVPTNLDPRILALAKQITANDTTMYDMATALENYLRSNYTYNVNISPPAGQEPISWFLFGDARQGFCNYFASAMTIMARELGIPARVAVGYTNGKVDSKTGLSIISGTDAHAWVQVYFANYGWVNFEPSASFSTFSRPTTSSAGSPIIPSGGSSVLPTGKGATHVRPGDVIPAGSDLTPGSAQSQSAVRAQISITLLALFALILGGLIFFSIWWRRLFRGLSIPAQIYGRVCLLAAWAGIATRRSQTPYEHMHALAEATPDQTVTLERLGDIYVRERWADPESTDHPRRTGEIDQLPGLWKGLQRRLMLYVLSHPHFLRLLPGRAARALRSLRPRRKRPSSSVIVEERIVSGDANPLI